MSVAWLVLGLILCIAIIVSILLVLRQYGVFTRPAATSGQIVSPLVTLPGISYGAPTSNTLVSMTYVSNSTSNVVNYFSAADYRAPPGVISITGVNVLSNVNAYVRSNTQQVHNFPGPYNYTNLNVSGSFLTVGIIS